MTTKGRKAITLVAIDGNWLAHRSMHTVQGQDERNTAKIVARQIVSWAFQYAMAHQATHFFVAFDGPDNFRREVYPLYKSSRLELIGPDNLPLSKEAKREALLSGAKFTRKPDVMDTIIKFSRKLLGAYNVPCVQAQRLEADDVLCAVPRLIEDLHHVHAVLVTKDKDMLQSLTPRVRQWYPNQDRTQPPITIRHSDLSERLTKYVGPAASEWTPAQFLDYQILHGDSTDDIPEVLSRAKSIRVVCDHGSLAEFYKTDAGSDFYWAHSTELKRNRRLVRMRVDALDDMSIDDFEYPFTETVPLAVIQESGKYLPRNHADYVGWRKGATRSLFG